MKPINTIQEMAEELKALREERDEWKRASRIRTVMYDEVRGANQKLREENARLSGRVVQLSRLFDSLMSEIRESTNATDDWCDGYLSMAGMEKAHKLDPSDYSCDGNCDHFTPMDNPVCHGCVAESGDHSLPWLHTKPRIPRD